MDNRSGGSLPRPSGKEAVGLLWQVCPKRDAMALLSSLAPSGSRMEGDKGDRLGGRASYQQPGALCLLCVLRHPQPSRVFVTSVSKSLLRTFDPIIETNKKEMLL